MVYVKDLKFEEGVFVSYYDGELRVYDPTTMNCIFSYDLRKNETMDVYIIQNNEVTKIGNVVRGRFTSVKRVIVNTDTTTDTWWVETYIEI